MFLRQNLDFLATLFHEAGVLKWVVSPGSRNAPIVASFIRHGGFELFSFPDERSAAFAALGMSQASAYPCGVICTSGTAVLNLYPAVCEAYYQRIPLVVLTADRPEEIIDQWDGQTIHQKEIFEKHILASYETPQNSDKKEVKKELEKMIYSAVETALSPVQGPVHINIPLRDPIYSDLDKPFFDQTPEKHFLFLKPTTQKLDTGFLKAELSQYNRILIVAGQQTHDHFIEPALATVASRFPLLSDITGNYSQYGINGWEMGLQTVDENFDLQPELLITFGLSVTSKKLKHFLRNFPPAEHWHIAASGFTGDPFESKPETKTIEPATFFETIAGIDGIENPDYLNTWKKLGASGRNNEDIWPPLNSIQRKELSLVKTILQHSDATICLHFGNSMSIRYAGWAGFTTAEVFCNRGTSGIDGTLSTAVGYALAQPDKKVICILGDIAFFYDSNALWTDKIPQNLQIVIINNHGGKIFEFISGPENEPALMPYIQTPHTLNASHLAAHFGIPYFSQTLPATDDILFRELNKNTISILEFFSDETT